MTNNIKFLSCLTFIVFVGLSSFSFSQEGASPEMKAAGKLVDSMDMEKLLKDSLETTLETQMVQFEKMGMSPEGVAELEEAMLKFMLDAMSWEDLRPEFVKLYSESFTVKELDEIYDFYQTPTGKKALSESPRLMAQGMLLGQQRIEARQAELQALITPIITKHLGQ